MASVFTHLQNGITIIKTLWVYVQTAVLVSVPNKLVKKKIEKAQPAAVATEMSSPNLTAISAIKC